MAQKPAALKVVLDTNVVISATLFGSGVLKPLRLAWQAGRVLPVISKETRAELLRVLAYEKFKLSEADIARVLALYLSDAQFHKVDLAVNNGIQIPVCRDERDQIFLDLAQSAKVDCLLGGDQDLLVLAPTPNLPFRILKPTEFLTQYGLLT
jgi:uncharacterized protein